MRNNTKLSLVRAILSVPPGKILELKPGWLEELEAIVREIALSDEKVRWGIKPLRRKMFVLKYRYGLMGAKPMTLAQIANSKAIHGGKTMSGRRIGQLCKSAIRLLKHPDYVKRLRKYVY